MNPGSRIHESSILKKAFRKRKAFLFDLVLKEMKKQEFKCGLELNKTSCHSVKVVETNWY